MGKTRGRFTRPVPQATGTPYGKAGSMWSSGHHTGLDFPAPTGQPVVSCADGRVTYAGDTGGAYGKQVKVTHAPGFETWYCHLSSINVQRGMGVIAGQNVGTVGATGNVTGPHLHLEVRVNGVTVDPAPYVNGTKAAPGGSRPFAGTTTNPDPDAGDLESTRPAPVAGGVVAVADTGTAEDVADGVRDLALTGLLVLGGFALVVVGALAVAAPAVRKQIDAAGDRLEHAAKYMPQGKGAGAAGAATKTPTKGMTP